MGNRSAPLRSYQVCIATLLVGRHRFICNLNIEQIPGDAVLYQE